MYWHFQFIYNSAVLEDKRVILKLNIQTSHHAISEKQNSMHLVESQRIKFDLSQLSAC